MSGEQQLGLGLQRRQESHGSNTLRNGLSKHPTQESLDGSGPGKPGNNSHAADWERVGERDRSVLWVTLTLQKD